MAPAIISLGPVSAIDCARFRSTTVYRTSKFVRHGENGEQGRVHYCRTTTTQTLAYEKLRWICCFDLIFWENGKVEIILFPLIIFMICMSGEYGGWGIDTVLFLAKNSRTSNEMWARALSWCKSHELFFHKSERFFRIASRKRRWTFS